MAGDTVLVRRMDMSDSRVRGFSEALKVRAGVVPQRVLLEVCLSERAGKSSRRLCRFCGKGSGVEETLNGAVSVQWSERGDEESSGRRRAWGLRAKWLLESAK